MIWSMIWVDASWWLGDLGWGLQTRKDGLQKEWLVRNESSCACFPIPYLYTRSGLQEAPGVILESSPSLTYSSQSIGESRQNMSMCSYDHFSPPPLLLQSISPLVCWHRFRAVWVPAFTLVLFSLSTPPTHTHLLKIWTRSYHSSAYHCPTAFQHTGVQSEGPTMASNIHVICGLVPVIWFLWPHLPHYLPLSFSPSHPGLLSVPPSCQVHFHLCPFAGYVLRLDIYVAFSLISSGLFQVLPPFLSPLSEMTPPLQVTLCSLTFISSSWCCSLLLDTMLDHYLCIDFLSSSLECKSLREGTCLLS